MKICLPLLFIVISSYIALSYCAASAVYDFATATHKRVPMSKYPGRYYVDKTTATCKRFIYKGAGGTNFNNFASMEECQKEFEFDYVSRLGTCQAEGNPSTATDLNNNGNDTFNVCSKTPTERFYFKKGADNAAGTCHSYQFKGCNEPKFSFPSEAGCKGTCVTTEADYAIPNKVDCEVGAILTATTAEEREIKIVRDTEKSTCVHAIVDKTATRGVFGTFTQCQKTCHADAAETKRCTSAPFQPSTVGQITTKYYYNAATKLCVQMMAIDGNVDSSKNYFDTAAECISACPATNEDDTEANLPDIPTVCDQPKAAGNGNEETTLPKWYFDATEKACKRFAYTGVGGNTNNFETEALCNYVCIEGVNGIKLPDPATTVAPAPAPEPVPEVTTETAPAEGGDGAVTDGGVAGGDADQTAVGQEDAGGDNLSTDDDKDVDAEDSG